MTLAGRLKAMGQARYQSDGDPKTSGPGFGLTLHPDKLEEPLRWRKPRMVFVNSMSDLFHEEIPEWFIYRVFAAMKLANKHTYQILTKRPERAREVLADAAAPDLIEQHIDDLADEIGLRKVSPEAYWRLSRARSGWRPLGPYPLPNVWLGVSIENARYTWRADVLREIPAAVRFISAEPLLGSLLSYPGYDECNCNVSAMEGHGLHAHGCSIFSSKKKPLDLTGIDWLIVGGESGGRFARPMHPDWARKLRDAALATQHPPECCGNPDYPAVCCGRFLPTGECCSDPVPGDPECCQQPEQSADPGTAFFFKQWGSWAPTLLGQSGDVVLERDGTSRPVHEALPSPTSHFMHYVGTTPKSGGRLLDGREWNEMPVREAVAA